MREWFDGLLAVVFAPMCVVCRQPLDQPRLGCVCPACWRAVVTVTPPVCDLCGAHARTSRREGGRMLCASCTGGDHAVSRARSIGPHLGALRSIIHAFKYDGRRSLARPLAQMMRDAGEDLLEEATVVVPVPLHPQRRRERGFNQATDLARYMGPPVSHALRRVRRTPTQTGLPATARQANVRRAFRTTWRARRLRGATVLLVDDVSTTGATLAACAQALKVDGVAKVLAITAARADP